MAIVTINDEHLTNIAGAIREKNGTEDTYKPSDMAAAISAIQAGGGEVNMVEAKLTGSSSSTGYTPFNVYDYVDDTENIICIYLKTNVDKTNYLSSYFYVKGYGFYRKNVSNVEYFKTADLLGAVTNPYTFSYDTATEFPTGTYDDACVFGIDSQGRINTFKWNGSGNKWNDPSNSTASSSYLHIWMLYK